MHEAPNTDDAGYRDALANLIERALRRVVIEDPSEWLGVCPPPSDRTPRPLDELMAGTQESTPVFLFSAHVPPIEEEVRPGFLVYGHSRLEPMEGGPGSHLEPPLERVAFTALVTPDMDTTYYEVLTNQQFSYDVRIPLAASDTGLYAPTETISDENAAIAVIYFL